MLRCENPGHFYSIYGPTNPLRKNELGENHDITCEKSPNGICHMMTCQCREVDYDGIPYDDWYTGRCQICDVKIDG